MQRPLSIHEVADKFIKSVTLTLIAALKDVLEIQKGHQNPQELGQRLDKPVLMCRSGRLREMRGIKISLDEYRKPKLIGLMIFLKEKIEKNKNQIIKLISKLKPGKSRADYNKKYQNTTGYLLRSREITPVNWKKRSRQMDTKC